MPSLRKWLSSVGDTLTLGCLFIGLAGGLIIVILGFTFAGAEHAQDAQAAPRIVGQDVFFSGGRAIVVIVDPLVVDLVFSVPGQVVVSYTQEKDSRGRPSNSWKVVYERNGHQMEWVYDISNVVGLKKATVGRIYFQTLLQ